MRSKEVCLAIFSLCEATEEQADIQLQRVDLDEASKQFWRGRKYEAKGIRRTIGDVFHEVIRDQKSG